MDDDRSDLIRSLLEPVEIEPYRPRWHWVWVALIAAVVVVGVLLVRRGPEESVATSEDGVASVEVEPSAAAADATDESTSPAPSEEVAVQYPTGRIHGSMAADPSTGTVVVLGGRPGFRDRPFLDAWARDDAGTWRALTSTLEPPDRELTGLLYVDSREQFVLVGGADTPTSLCSPHILVTESTVDMWALDVDSVAWFDLTPATGPPDRWGHASVYDPVTDSIVLFGGVGDDFTRNRGNLLGDTWIYSVSSGEWSHIDTQVAPPPRACAGLVFDPVRERMVLWGGMTDDSNGDPSVWTFDPESRSWAEEEILGDGPVPRWLHAMVADPVTGDVHVIGGWGYQTIATDSGSQRSAAAYDEVWRLADGSWVVAEPLPEPTGNLTATVVDGRILVWAGVLLLEYDVFIDRWTDLTPYDELEIVSHDG